MTRIILGVSVASVCVVAALLAQTRTKTSQISWPVTTSVRMLALANGKVVTVSAGSGLEIVQVGQEYQIRASSQAGAAARLTRQSDGSWPLPSGCALWSVYRNGLRQWQGVDYSATSSAIRFDASGSDVSETDDVVIAECR